jgi:hypothetical protein
LSGLVAVALASRPLCLWGDEQTYGDYVYPRPGFFTFLTRIPGDFVDFGKNTFQWPNAPYFALVGGSTALLLYRDQYLVDQAHALGNRWGIEPTDHQKTLVSIPLPASSFQIGVPNNKGSALYFIGDGWTHLFLSAGFFTYGLAGNNNRSLQTSTEILEGILASGTVVQVIKHMTGRQDPYMATEPGGKWQWFPNQTQYARHVPAYDAFPSGHLTAATAVFTIVKENYPEYRWIGPVGYTALGLLSYQMLNNGVHWASDYPLAIALGYGFGKVAVARGRRLANPEPKSGYDFHVFPGFVGDSTGLWLVCQWN